MDPVIDGAPCLPGAWNAIIVALVLIHGFIDGLFEKENKSAC
jgi:hypothetical protein